MSEIKERLKRIRHPEIDLDIVELGMIGDIQEEGENVTVELKLPFKGIQAKRMMIDRIEKTLRDRSVKVRPLLMNRKHKSEFFLLAGDHWNRG